MTSPDGPWKTANILADGPSVLQVRDEHLLPGPCIALNCAIRLQPFIRIDVWASVDSPANLWDAVNGHFKDHMDVLTVGNNVLAWEERIAIERILALEPVYLTDNGEIDGEFMLDPKGRRILMPTITFTLAYLFKYRQTQHVRIFGADMKGVNGPLHPYFAFDEEDDRDSRMRWTGERLVLAASMRLFRNDGRRAERYFVDPG